MASRILRARCFVRRVTDGREIAPQIWGGAALYLSQLEWDAAFGLG